MIATLQKNKTKFKNKEIKQMSKQITKSYLEYLGVTEVTEDGKIFTQKGELKPTFSGNGTRPNEQRRYELRIQKNGERARVLVHQIVYSWFHGEVPYGKEIHHRDGNHLNNNLDNLIALTPDEHRKEHRKMRELKQQEAIVEEKCRLDIPREHYVKKIEEYMSKADYANANQYKRRLKYYDNHIAEANQKIQDMKDLELLKYLKDEYRKSGDKRRWHMYNDIIKHWKEHDSKVKEEIMKCALGKMGTFGGNN